MRTEKLPVRILESVIAAVVAAFMVIAPTAAMANGLLAVNATSVIAAAVCYLVAVMAVVFDVSYLKNSVKRSPDQIILMPQKSNRKAA